MPCRLHTDARLPLISVTRPVTRNSQDVQSKELCGPGVGCSSTRSAFKADRVSVVSSLDNNGCEKFCTQKFAGTAKSSQTVTLPLEQEKKGHTAPRSSPGTPKQPVSIWYPSDVWAGREWL
jgi:hypothetical protein